MSLKEHDPEYFVLFGEDLGVMGVLLGTLESWEKNIPAEHRLLMAHYCAKNAFLHSNVEAVALGIKESVIAGVEHLKTKRPFGEHPIKQQYDTLDAILLGMINNAHCPEEVKVLGQRLLFGNWGTPPRMN